MEEVVVVTTDDDSFQGDSPAENPAKSKDTGGEVAVAVS